jgi:hypothetical protein
MAAWDACCDIYCQTITPKFLKKRRRDEKNLNLLLLVVLIIIVSGIAHTRAALAISDKIIKQRIEEEATGSFHLRGTKVDLAVEDRYDVFYGRL